MRMIAVLMIKKSDFSPLSWLRNAHAQTIAPLILRRRFAMPTFEETLWLPDGDFLELAWTEPYEKRESGPIVIVLHGLAGSKESVYIKGMLQSITAHGWTGVLMHFRGCGKKPNDRAAAYHSGETDDVRFFIHTLKQRYPRVPLAAVGFSLGGNVLVKYLGEEQHSSPLVAGVSVSAPLDLADCSRRINKGLSKIYQTYLLAPLKQGVREKLIRFKQELPLKRKGVQAIKTMWQFDDRVTAPLFGFSGADEYYKQSSGKSFLKKIAKPCLMIHAKDDPFMTDACLPFNHELSDTVTFELSAAGGHLGFVAEGRLMQPVFWCESRVPEFLKAYF